MKLKQIKKEALTLKTTPLQLEKRLEQFFLDTITATKTHLYQYLHIDWITAIELKKANPDIKLLLIAAENLCELRVIEIGFAKDNSFARYYLDKYQVTPGDVFEQKEDHKIEIVLDTGPLGQD